MSVKVAVRLRPFNQRELDMQSKLVVEMNGKYQTKIENPEDGNKREFNFDFSFWSHDGFHINSEVEFKYYRDIMREWMRSMLIKEPFLIRLVKRFWIMPFKDIIAVCLHMAKLEQVKVILWSVMEQIR